MPEDPKLESPNAEQLKALGASIVTMQGELKALKDAGASKDELALIRAEIEELKKERAALKREEAAEPEVEEGDDNRIALTLLDL